METITHGMVYLDGERQQHFSPCLSYFPRVNIGAKKFSMCAMLILKLVKLTQGLAETKNIFSRDSSLGR
jgi:hypothetical protein